MGCSNCESNVKLGTMYPQHVQIKIWKGVMVGLWDVGPYLSCNVNKHCWLHSSTTSSEKNFTLLPARKQVFFIMTLLSFCSVFSIQTKTKLILIILSGVFNSIKKPMTGKVGVGCMPSQYYVNISFSVYYRPIVPLQKMVSTKIVHPTGYI